MKEITKKFLCSNNSWKDFIKQPKIQNVTVLLSYIRFNPEVLVKLEHTNDNLLQASIAIKASIPYEYLIPAEDAFDLIKKEIPESFIAFERYSITTTRDPYFYFSKINYTQQWDLKIYKDKNEGLIINEVFLRSENEELLAPGWIGEEITGKKEYEHCELIQNPYIESVKTSHNTARDAIALAKEYSNSQSLGSTKAEIALFIDWLQHKLKVQMNKMSGRI